MGKRRQDGDLSLHTWTHPTATLPPSYSGANKTTWRTPVEFGRGAFQSQGSTRSKRGCEFGNAARGISTTRQPRSAHSYRMKLDTRETRDTWGDDYTKIRHTRSLTEFKITRQSSVFISALVEAKIQWKRLVRNVMMGSVQQSQVLIGCTIRCDPDTTFIHNHQKSSTLPPTKTHFGGREQRDAEIPK